LAHPAKDLIFTAYRSQFQPTTQQEKRGMGEGLSYSFSTLLMHMPCNTRFSGRLWRLQPLLWRQTRRHPQKVADGEKKGPSAHLPL
jgi:hypothetical protein